MKAMPAVVGGSGGGSSTTTSSSRKSSIIVDSYKTPTKSKGGSTASTGGRSSHSISSSAKTSKTSGGRKSSSSRTRAIDDRRQKRQPHRSTSGGSSSSLASNTRDSSQQRQRHHPSSSSTGSSRHHYESREHRQQQQQQQHQQNQQGPQHSQQIFRRLEGSNGSAGSAYSSTSRHSSVHGRRSAEQQHPLVTPTRSRPREQPEEGSKTAPPSKHPHKRSDSNGSNGWVSGILGQATPGHSSTKQRRDGVLPQHAGAKHAIDELNKAIGHERRIAAITNACAEFDHWDEAKHNAELHLGSANVLSMLLSMTGDDDEIRMICAALEMVYRASTEVVCTSFHEVGAAVVPLMLRLLERCESGSMKHADVSILNITKVLLYYSRVSELRVPLARHQGLLVSLVRVATSILNPECRVIRMRVLANLANSEDNKVTMFEHTGLVESVLKIATLDLSDSAREYASASLMDLASSPLNQILMARNDKLLGTLVKLGVIDDKAETREYAVTALQNLAFSKENRVRLVTFGSGVVLEALKKTVSSDPNDKARRRAAGALTNLACDDTAERMGCHKGLLETLSDVSTQDNNEDVQKRASLALTKIATSVTVEMPCFGVLLDSLVCTALSSHVSGIAAVLRVKARAIECRERMAHHPGILETLADIATGKRARRRSAKDRENAMRAIMHLTNESRNRKEMCNRYILDALVMGASLTEAEGEETRDSAVVAIERLATELSNRQQMARHEGLIVAVAQATEREFRAELAGEESKSSGQQRLAKPLLMSLLVAM